ncbi:HAD family hydrolase [Microbacterium esteraromaticum]|uniref:HAD family hydrolase n=1 Tax=Microbacterium esteraromaticum TaxID=57043 RepID=UPI001D7256BF|nr:HAD-IA family hydrolase [Microbacterium esteraromaticum]MBM7466930.1 HAD superfamily hydrolase (TIGR01493 family) [Microbacterium esteraromaticum]
MPARKWILFDIGGVLEIVDDDAWQDQWWSRWCERTGLERPEFDARVEGADLPPIDITAGHEAVFWQRLAVALDLEPDDSDAMRADFWDAYCGTANTELIEYARSLAPRAGVAILSNSADGAREEEERRFGFSSIFDPICYSHEQGVNKPDPRAYREALRRMGADPADVFFVDDRRMSIDGAAAVGIRGILHRENAATIAAVDAFLLG